MWLPSMVRYGWISELVARKILRGKYGNRRVFSASLALVLDLDDSVKF